MKTEVATEDVARTLGVSASPARGWLRRVARWLLLAAAAALVAVAVKAAIGRARRTPAPAYTTVAATRMDLRVTVSATGTLAALGVVEVGSEVSGRVQSVLGDYNQRVTKGQVLATIDPVQLKAEVTQASAQLAASQAAVDTAQATLVETTQALHRAETQMKEALVSTKDVEAARAAYDRAVAAIASAKANATLAAAGLSSSRWKLGKTTIVSPIDGIVLSRSVEPGQTVAATFQTPVLFKLATDLTSLELHVQVDESDIGRVREGMQAEFRVDAYPDKVFSSQVFSVRNEAKTSSNVVYYEALLTADNAQRLLRPGMTVTATITSEQRSNALVVPNAALRFQPSTSASFGPFASPQEAQMEKPLPKGRKRVYVLAPGATTPTGVELTAGATDGTNTEVSDTTLAPGAAIVTDLEESAP